MTYSIPSQALGFESLFNLLKDPRNETQYPPCNVWVKNSTTDASLPDVELTLALAGFSQQDLSVVLHGRKLMVSGDRTKPSNADDAPDTKTAAGEFKVKQISQRAFQRTFVIAEHLEVSSVQFQDGLLTIALVYDIPEAQKPRELAINGLKALTRSKTNNRMAD